MSNMVVRTNVMSLNSHRNLKTVGSQQAKASSRLSSGYKINSAADDAAGLAISEKMRAQIRGLDQASTNAQDAISLIQTAEGGMQEINNMVQRIRELVVKASNDTNDQQLGAVSSQGDRQKIQDEIDQLVAEIDSMSERVEFNNKRLINGTYSDGTVQDLPQITAGAGGVAQTPEDIAAAALNQLLISQDFLDLTAAAADPAYTGNGDTELAAFLDGIGALASDALANPSTLKTNGLWSSLTDDTFATGVLSDLVLQSGNGETYSDFDTEIDSLVGQLSAILTDLQGTVTLADITDNITGNAAQIGTHALALAADSNWSDLMSSTDTDTAALQAAMSKLTAAHTTKAGLEADFNDFMTELKALAADTSATDNAEAVALLAEMYDNTTAAGALLGQLMADKVAAIDLATVAGGGGGGMYFQIGANANQSLTLSINSVNSRALGIGDGNQNTSINVVRTSGADINGYLTGLDSALTFVTTERSKLGAAQNRLEYTMRSLDISSENLSASESRIRDTDMAKEMMNLTQANVLQQAATSMLAQANMAPQSVLQLLQ